MSIEPEDAHAGGHLADKVLDLRLLHLSVVGQVDVEVAEVAELVDEVEFDAGAGVDVPHDVEDADDVRVI